VDDNNLFLNSKRLMNLETELRMNELSRMGAVLPCVSSPKAAKSRFLGQERSSVLESIVTSVLRNPGKNCIGPFRIDGVEC
jgi:hypothetical protein